MIARVWSARTTPALSTAYLEHFSQNVQPSLQKLTGFLGFIVNTRASAAEVEIVVTTYWQSLAAIDAFAGPDRDSATTKSRNQASPLVKLRVSADSLP